MAGWSWSRRRTKKHQAAAAAAAAEIEAADNEATRASTSAVKGSPFAEQPTGEATLKRRVTFDRSNGAAAADAVQDTLGNKTAAQTSATTPSGAAVPQTPAEQATAAPAPLPPRPPLPPPKLSLHIDQILTGIVVVIVVFLLLFVKLVNPGFLLLLVSCLVGTVIGLGYSYLFAYNRKRKAELQQVLSYDPGLKGLQALLGELPSWISYTRKEKLEDAVEPILDTSKPAFIKRIFFKKLTFGDAPFRVEGIWVNQSTEELMIELDVRWSGDANITLAIEMASEATKMCPKVTDIAFVGNLRIRLKPLLDKIPVAGVAMISFVKPPIIKFDLDFGAALGGGLLPRQIMRFIDGIIQSTVSNMLVWPNRVVVPIGPDMAEEAQRQELQDVGVMRVTVLSAKGLQAADISLTGNPTSDPIVELSINPKNPVETSCKKKTLTPEWNETFYLLVQEPKDQYMRVVVSDVDAFNAKDINLWKGTVGIGSRTLLGRAQIQVRDITAREGQPVEVPTHLGKGEWGDDGGPGKGEGQLFMRCLYKSFGNITEQDVEKQEGILLMKVKKVMNIESTAKGRPMRISIIAKLGKNEQQGPIVDVKPVQNEYGEWEYHHTFTSPVRFSFFDIGITSEIKIKVREAGSALAGSLADTIARSPLLTVGDVAEAKDMGQPGVWNRKLELTDNATKTSMELEMRYVPKF